MELAIVREQLALQGKFTKTGILKVRQDLRLLS